MPKSDKDGVHDGPQNRLLWGRASERPAAHIHPKIDSCPPPGRSAVKRSTTARVLYVTQGQNIRLPLPVHLKVSNIEFLFCI